MLVSHDYVGILLVKRMYYALYKRIEMWLSGDVAALQEQRFKTGTNEKPGISRKGEWKKMLFQTNINYSIKI